eukprot:11403262-Alexandrium_andersonii.AAC.1
MALEVKLEHRSCTDVKAVAGAAGRRLLLPSSRSPGEKVGTATVLKRLNLRVGEELALLEDGQNARA